jgi:hypothetical protein
VKLSEAQKRALSLLPIKVTMWGGKPFTSLPRGVRSVSTLESLRRRGLCTSKFAGNEDIWTITDLGRAALTEKEPRLKE